VTTKLITVRLAINCTTTGMAASSSLCLGDAFISSFHQLDMGRSFELSSNNLSESEQPIGKAIIGSISQLTALISDHIARKRNAFTIDDEKATPYDLVCNIGYLKAPFCRRVTK
jgi:hypothetical protein